MPQLMPWGANYTITAEIGGKSNQFTLVPETIRTNLLPNPNMDNASLATYYQAIKITETRSTDYAYSGTYSMKGVIDDGTTGQYFQVLQTAGAMIDVVAGETYTFSAYIYLPTSNTADTTWRAQLYFWNGTTYTGAFSGTSTTIVRGNWTRLSVTATVPAGYYKALPRILPTTTLAVGQVAYVDAWLLETGSTLLPYFDGTYSSAYSGYTLASQAWTGTANASQSTSNWYLNTDLAIPALDGNSYLEGKILPKDITSRIQDVTITRGRNDPFQDIMAGRANLVLRNDDRALDPVNSSSPFWSTLDNASGVTLKRKVVIYYESTPIFTGLITDIDISYEIGPNNITISNVVFEVSDALADLASRSIEEYFPAVQLSGARVQTILALPEINYTGATSIDAGTVDCLDDPIGDQTNCLTALQTVAKTESGYLFAKGDNTLRFTNRIGPGFYTPSVFADNGTGVPYENLAIVYGEETLYNRVVVTPIDSAYSAVAENTSSQSLYGIKTLALNGLLFSDSDALKMADYLLSLYGTPSYRFNDMQLKFAGQKVSLANQAIIMGLDLGSVIRVVKTFSAGTPNSITQDAAIELIKHHITPTTHEIEFALAPALTVYPMVLDDPVYGITDSIYALIA